MVFLNATQGVFSIILMIAIGYYLSHKGWFDNKSSKLISKLVVNVALPSYMISNLMTTYDREKLLQLKKGLVVPFLSIGLCFAISILVAKLIKIQPNRKGTFSSMFFLSNAVFVGLPVNLALFGDESVPLALLYYIANTTMFWTIGVYMISTDGDKGDSRLFSLESIKRIFSPPLLGFLAAILLILIGVKLPGSIGDTLKYLGNLTTPLSMLFIGIVIYSVNLRKIRVDRSMFVLLAGRFILAPMIAVLLGNSFGLPLLMKKVFLIQAAMPAMTQTSIIAENYGGDREYAALMTAVTTFVSLAAIPFYMLLISSTGIL